MDGSEAAVRMDWLTLFTVFAGTGFALGGILWLLQCRRDDRDFKARQRSGDEAAIVSVQVYR